jgi:hypothetical protein
VWSGTATGTAPGGSGAGFHPSEPVSGGPAWARATDAAEKRDREW